MRKFFTSFILLILVVSGAYAADNSILVNQPAYHAMNFHVYKPVDIPAEYYVTYDGYIVYKADDGVWKYASIDSHGINKTGYVVGSVIPSIMKLNPYDKKKASIAPVMAEGISQRSTRRKLTIPITPVGSREEITTIELPPRQEIKIDLKAKNKQINYVPPRPNEIYEPLIFTPTSTNWTRNSNFMAISKWQKSIDRIGILDRPKTPIAWKSDYPEVIYAWTGLQWRQMSARGKNIPALSTIRREVYALTVHTNKLNLLRWGDNDSSVLAQYAAMWGYKWLGQIITGREY